MDHSILRSLTDLWFTVFPTGFTLQWFDLFAAILNGIAGALGIDVKFLGL